MKIFLPGGAGLVGINLIASIQSSNPDWEIVVVDKNLDSIKIARRIFPNVIYLCEDLSYTKNQKWPSEIRNCDICIMLQAEIGGVNDKLFEINNIKTTKLILNELKKLGFTRIIHISSSVVNSKSSDLYTKTKRKQELIVSSHFPDSVILRPTLMFGWFDRKHLGWLSNLMVSFPFFPIPGKGQFIRQPLYVGDFCSVIKSCINDSSLKGTYDITGLEKIKYIDLMKMLKKIKSSKTLFIYLPIPLFSLLLRLWAFISNKPAFTSSQLYALIAGDQFELIDWPKIFKVERTDIEKALKLTHNDPRYSNIKIPF